MTSCEIVVTVRDELLDCSLCAKSGSFLAPAGEPRPLTSLQQRIGWGKAWAASRPLAPGSNHGGGARHLDLAAAECGGQGPRDVGIVFLASEGLDVINRDPWVHGRLIGPVGGHGVKGIRNGNDARHHRNFFALEAMGIAPA